jgi:hypothetical protein
MVKKSVDESYNKGQLFGGKIKIRCEWIRRLR